MIEQQKNFIIDISEDVKKEIQRLFFIKSGVLELADKNNPNDFILAKIGEASANLQNYVENIIKKECAHNSHYSFENVMEWTTDFNNNKILITLK